ncbi:MAG TPA: hypothetical protein VJ482_11930 [Acidimicrobiia bacterium]|nr:hypothetical protein [Acidimicrobiia bacterium]
MTATTLRYMTRESLQEVRPVWHEDPHCAGSHLVVVLDEVARKFASPCGDCSPMTIEIREDSDLRLLAPYGF